MTKQRYENSTGVGRDNDMNGGDKLGYPKFRNGNVTVTEREYFERIIQEVDARQSAERQALKELVLAKFESSERAVGAAFIGTEKAVAKAESAQSDYNVRSNEFRGQLDDQAKTLMPRIETVGLFKGVDDRIGATRIEIVGLVKALEDKSWAAHREIDKRIDEVKQDVVNLREFRSESGGEKSAARAARTEGDWRTPLILAISLFVIGQIITILIVMLKK
jgi:hypothetical protein